MSSSSRSAAGHGALFILSGPSGSGKTTLIRRLLDGGEMSGLAFSVSHTTRTPRHGEKNGEDYHFVTRDAFESMIEEGRFLEWAPVHDHLYGTSVDEVLPRLGRGVDVLLDIDVKGAEKVLGIEDGGLSREAVHGIFVLPPSYPELRRRLERRNLDEASAIERRLKVARDEIGRFENYEYVIINDHADRASRVLAAIILDKRHRRERVREQVEELLSGLRGS
jgi:guanylate kinase